MDICPDFRYRFDVTPRKPFAFFGTFFLAINVLLLLVASAQPAPQLIQLNNAQLWQRLEFVITNVPAASNPFDPDIIRLDATFTAPSGHALKVPAFWYQNYQRSQSGGYEQETPLAPPEWRLRFAPSETGNYSVSLAIYTNGQFYAPTATASFTVPATNAPAGSGYVHVQPGGQYFQTGDGQPLRLIGENVDWVTTGLGTYQYDTWLPHVAAAGENYIRLMMTPWSFGMETTTNTLTDYPLAPAWQLDYVVQEAEQQGLYFELNLNIHLMLQPVPDYWGSDNYWQSNPYNAANGGPCATQDDYFTNVVAQKTFQKTLRYVIARYGYSPKLLAWQLWSEIDNEYAYLNPSNVPPWHALMGDWLHTNDPFGHLVTTSLTGGSDRPEIWTLPQMDFACYHSYGEPYPAARLNTVAQSFHQNYGKPVLIDEFGTSGYGWDRTNDLYLRGFRQGLWGGALGGSVGTAISWWWDSIDAENDYSDYPALASILNRTGWGTGAWTNINFPAGSGSPPPTVGNLTPGGQPFIVVLVPSGVWAAMPSGRLAAPNPQAASYAGITLNSFLLGGWFPTLSVPFALNAWLTNNARVVIHINSVSDSSALAVRVDGTTVFSTNLPNLNGAGNDLVNESYNLDLPVDLPAGKHLIQLTNTANGWIYLDWVRLEQVLPSTYSSNWAPLPAAIGLRGPHESLLYVVAPGVSFSGSDTNAVLPLQQDDTVTMSNWPAGKFFADWYDPATGTNAGYTQASTTNGILTLPLPNFSADLAGIVYPPPALLPLGVDDAGAFEFQLNSETGGIYLIEQSPDLSNWTTVTTVTNATGALTLTNPSTAPAAKIFFRARRSQ
jgi:Domain of unknown function (DUF5060)